MTIGTANRAWLRALLLERFWFPDDPAVASTAEGLAVRDPVVDGDGEVTATLLTALATVWERGWQPADVVHAVAGPASAQSLAVALIAEHARVSDAASRAPAGWLRQLQELGALTPGGPTGVAAWQRTAGNPAAEAWRLVLVLATTLRTLAPIAVLMPPPSRWGTAGPRAGDEPAHGGARALRRIRALLAKAESTEFPEEAEMLTAKAQELMTRHAVDTALIDAAPGSPARGSIETARVHVRAPYVRAKMGLLASVAEANNVRLVWYQSLGIANLVGAAADVASVELLFTSLLLQVAQALAGAERPGRRPSALRSFRRAFLLGYAQRIGERLRSAREHATAAVAAERGVDMLPVLRSRHEAVDDAVSELFPRVRSSRSRAPVDAGGWHAGRAAAERADVGPRRSSLR